MIENNMKGELDLNVNYLKGLLSKHYTIYFTQFEFKNKLFCIF